MTGKTPYSTAILRNVETEKYYRARFQESDHKRLADALHNIKRAASCCPTMIAQVRELYADCIIEPFLRGVIRCLRKVWTALQRSPLFATMNYNGKRYILPKMKTPH